MAVQLVVILVIIQAIIAIVSKIASSVSSSTAKVSPAAKATMSLVANGLKSVSSGLTSGTVSVTNPATALGLLSKSALPVYGAVTNATNTASNLMNKIGSWATVGGLLTAAALIPASTPSSVVGLLAIGLVLLLALTQKKKKVQTTYYAPTVSRR